MVETKEAVAKPLTKEKAEGEKGEEQVEEERKEVEEKKVEEPIEAVEKKELIEEPIPTEQIEEEAVEEVEEVAPEVPEKELVEEKPKHTPLGKSRVIERATKEDFMEFARKFYPTLVEDFEAERIPFDELKAKIEHDVGLVWVDLKE